jgi:hypothetical protein
MLGVDMTSAVKGFFERAEMVQVHWLILLISVGWGPPDVSPGDACRARGPRVSCSRFTPARVASNRGGLSSEWSERAACRLGLIARPPAKEPVAPHGCWPR